jgi:hypothetical protein
MLKETEETAVKMSGLEYRYFGKHPHAKVGAAYEKECARIKRDEAKVDEEREKVLLRKI